ncbi:hypothetical protein I6E36_12740 [Fusobacterium mortiferum]|uniref:hypothetical protein n=1 Tax=Fusobacterium mortiferum TaxID=850 RepID=UPI001F3ED8FA|nr:hypothetical protein [Fusobacterium mortiferum]MCF2628945.1 hypothetical protein [Fusobacterium mortiferum]
MNDDNFEKIKAEIKQDFTYKEWIMLGKIMIFPGKKRIISLFLIILIFHKILIKKMLFPILLKNELKNFILAFISDSQTIFLALFGIIIMGYTIYQTLLSDEFVFILAATPAQENGFKKRSRFTMVSNYFYAFCLMTILLIIFNLLALSILRNDTVLKILVEEFPNIFYNKWFIKLSLWIYMYLALNAIFEIKSFLKTLLDSIKIDAFINKLDKK